VRQLSARKGLVPFRVGHVLQGVKTMLDRAYVKTEAGRFEIKLRALTMSRSVRNLLLMIDGGKTAAQWLSLVQGTLAADIEYLLAQGLIADANSGGVDIAVELDLSPLDYPQLYGFLTRHAKQYLGLMKGYRVVLDVERCSGLPELQTYALRFIDMVRDAQGEELARQVRRAMGMTA
jgi:hypothetical protein